jgi:hypothetical protein
MFGFWVIHFWDWIVAKERKSSANRASVVGDYCFISDLLSLERICFQTDSFIMLLFYSYILKLSNNEYYAGFSFDLKTRIFFLLNLYVIWLLKQSKKLWILRNI